MDTMQPVIIYTQTEYSTEAARGMADAIRCRLLHGPHEQLKEALNYGFTELNEAIDHIAEFHANAEEIGSSDVSWAVKSMFNHLDLQANFKALDEATAGK